MTFQVVAVSPFEEVSLSQKLHLFILDPGYVESSRLSTMLVQHAEGFEDPLTAMESFRQILVDYVTPPDKQLTECCQGTIDEYPKATYCHECGSRLTKTVLEPRILNLKVAEAFDRLSGMDIDTASDVGLWDLFEEAGWELVGDWKNLIKYPQHVVSVWHLLTWMEDGGGAKSYLEWHFPDGKTGSNRRT